MRNALLGLVIALAGGLAGGGLVMATQDPEPGPPGARGPAGPAGPAFSGAYVLVKQPDKCPKGTRQVNAEAAFSSNKTGVTLYMLCYIS